MQRNREHSEAELFRALEKLMRRIIDYVLWIVEGVDVKIEFDPVTILTFAHTLPLALNLNLNQEHERGHELAKLTCQVCGSAANFARFTHSTLGWWNGRHVRLRGVCRKACGFKSRPEHQYLIISNLRRIKRGCGLRSRLADSKSPYL